MSAAQETLKLLDELSTVASNNLSAEVVLETPLRGAAGIDLLKSAESRNRAIAFASSKGINRPGINETPDVYPISDDSGAPSGFRASIRIVGNPV